MARELNAILLSLGVHWVSAARMPKALHAAGFRVYACCFKDGMTANSRYTQGRACFDQPVSIEAIWQGLRMIYQRWRPDIVIPGDDVGMRLLHAFALHDDSGRDALDREIMALIRTSLGDPRWFPAVERKSALTALEAVPDLRFPSQAAAYAQDNIFEVAERVGYPLAIKRDHSAGGTGVSIVRTAAELGAFIATPATADRFTVTGPQRAYPVDGNGFLVQRLVDGWDASVSFAAVRGEMVASFAYRKLHGASALGPTWVAGLIDRADLTRQAAAIVRHFGFTGLGGVDFMVDASDDTGKVLEFNPRPTITSHLGPLFGNDLCAAFHAALTGAPVPEPTPPRRTTVALFPGEWMRDPTSPHLETAYHDVPWDEPFLMKALLRVLDSADRPLFASPERADISQPFSAGA